MNKELKDKYLAYGPSSLTDAELLAVSISVDTDKAKEIISAYNGSDTLSNILMVHDSEINDIKGIGPNKAMQLSCMNEISKRIWKSSDNSGTKFNNPSIVADYYTDLRLKEREEFHVAFLDVRSRLISETTMTIGTINSSLVSVRDVLIEALRRKAVSILIVHNHPSGTPDPSQEDCMVTEQINKGCQSIGIRLLDHVIIGKYGYYSFRERGVLE